MKTSGTTALIVSGMLALGLSACGGGDSEDSGSSSKKPSTTLTAPGTKLALGEPATVAWIPASMVDPTKDQKGYKLEVTVDSIEQGDVADLSDAVLTPEQKKMTPTFVKVTFKALEDAPTEADNPRSTMTVLDAEGGFPSANSGEYEACNIGTPPVPFKTGMTYESCSTYLLPEGAAAIASVDWAGGPTPANGPSKYISAPVLWSAK